MKGTLSFLLRVLHGCKQGAQFYISKEVNSLQDIRLSHARRTNQEQVTLVNLDMVRHRQVLLNVKVVRGCLKWVFENFIVGAPYGLVVTGKFVFSNMTDVSLLPPRFGSISRTIRVPSPTFDRVYRRAVTCALKDLAVLSKLLSLDLFPQMLILQLVVLTPPEPLVVVEDDGADGLLRPVLAHHVVVYPLFQISGVELRDAKLGLGEDGTAAGVLCRIVA